MPARQIALALALLIATACSGEGERAFKSSRPEFMQEMKKALLKANVPFREDAEGFIRYSTKYEEAVETVAESVEKGLSRGGAWRLDDQPTREYLVGVLGSMGVKYILEPRKDEEWIRWYPANEAQEREVGQKVAEFRFNRKMKEKAARP